MKQVCIKIVFMLLTTIVLNDQCQGGDKQSDNLYNDNAGNKLFTPTKIVFTSPGKTGATDDLHKNLKVTDTTSPAKNNNVLNTPLNKNLDSAIVFTSGEKRKNVFNNIISSEYSQLDDENNYKVEDSHLNMNKPLNTSHAKKRIKTPLINDDDDDNNIKESHLSESVENPTALIIKFLTECHKNGCISEKKPIEILKEKLADKKNSKIVEIINKIKYYKFSNVAKILLEVRSKNTNYAQANMNIDLIQACIDEAHSKEKKSNRDDCFSMICNKILETTRPKIKNSKKACLPFTLDPELSIKIKEQKNSSSYDSYFITTNDIIKKNDHKLQNKNAKIINFTFEKTVQTLDTAFPIIWDYLGCNININDTNETIKTKLSDESMVVQSGCNDAYILITKKSEDNEKTVRIGLKNKNACGGNHNQIGLMTINVELEKKGLNSVKLNGHLTIHNQENDPLDHSVIKFLNELAEKHRVDQTNNKTQSTDFYDDGYNDDLENLDDILFECNTKDRNQSINTKMIIDNNPTEIDDNTQTDQTEK